jgi:tRNA(adenine34) deaminase
VVIYGPGGEEITTACPSRAATNDPTALAEVLALRQAGQILGRWRLTGCTMVTTLEPGVMSAGAIVLSRLTRLVVGSWDVHHGAITSKWDLVRDTRLNHWVEVFPQVLQAECDALLASYLDRADPTASDDELWSGGNAPFAGPLG